MTEVNHDWPHTFRDGRAIFSCGWVMSEVPLDARGYDRLGWWWGEPRPGHRLFRCTDGADSVTVRAPNLYWAVATMVERGMPPRELGKVNWKTWDYASSRTLEALRPIDLLGLELMEDGELRDD